MSVPSRRCNCLLPRNGRFLECGDLLWTCSLVVVLGLVVGLRITSVVGVGVRGVWNLRRQHPDFVLELLHLSVLVFDDPFHLIDGSGILFFLVVSPGI